MPRRRSTALHLMTTAIATGVLGGTLFGVLGEGLGPAIIGLLLGMAIAVGLHGAIAMTRRSGLLGRVRESKPLLIVQHMGTILAVLGLAGVLLLAMALPVPLTARAVLGLGGVLALGLALVFLSLRWNADVPSPTKETPSRPGHSTVCLHAGLIVLSVAAEAALGNWVVPQVNGEDGTLLASLDNRLKAIETTVKATDEKVDGVQGVLGDMQKIQASDSEKIAQLLELANEANTSDEELREQIRAEIEAEYADELARERNARDAAERATQAVMDIRNVEGLEAALREHGGQAIIDALLALPAPTAEIQAEIHRKVAQWAYLIGNIEQAERSLGVLLSIDPNDIDAVNEMGILYYGRGEFDAAEKAHRRVLSLAGDDRSWQAAAHGNLGAVQYMLGKLPEAEKSYRDALAIEKKRDHKLGMAHAHGNIGLILRALGKDDGAKSEFTTSLRLYTELDNKVGMANQHGNLGLILHERDELDAAWREQEKALAINEALERRAGIASQYAAMALILQSRGDMAGARAKHEDALEIYESLSDKHGMANQHANLGLIAINGGNAAEARRHWRLARDLYAKIGMRQDAEKMQGWLDGLPPG